MAKAAAEVAIRPAMNMRLVKRIKLSLEVLVKPEAEGARRPDKDTPYAKAAQASRGGSRWRAWEPL
ncbi:hypothetical protein GCM10019059_05100 [Camelimonas fluminis]|nr:hypothetical protein GCM10019059_05100 [Camelimonas fluminis]